MLLSTLDRRIKFIAVGEKPGECDAERDALCIPTTAPGAAEGQRTGALVSGSTVHLFVNVSTHRGKIISRVEVKVQSRGQAQAPA